MDGWMVVMIISQPPRVIGHESETFMALLLFRFQSELLYFTLKPFLCNWCDVTLNVDEGEETLFTYCSKSIKLFCGNYPRLSLPTKGKSGIWMVFCNHKIDSRFAQVCLPLIWLLIQKLDNINSHPIESYTASKSCNKIRWQIFIGLCVGGEYWILKSTYESS